MKNRGSRPRGQLKLCALREISPPFVVKKSNFAPRSNHFNRSVSMKIQLLLAFFLLKTALSTAQSNCADAFLYEANIRAITERGTSVWVGTDLGLVEIDRATRAVLKRYDRNNSVIDGPVTALGIGSDGSLLVGTNTFWRTKNGIFFQKELDAGAEIRDIREQNDSIIWVSTAVGIWRLGKVVGGEHFTKSNSLLPNNWANRARPDPAGNMWFGLGQPFSQGGLLKVPADGSAWKFYKKPTSPLPQTSAVRDLLVDKDGAIWMAAQDQILKFDTAGVWASFDPEPNFGGDYNACSIAQKPTGEIVVGMENGVAVLSPGGTWASHPMPGIFGDNVFIFNTLAASDGTVWAGSNVNGLGILKDNLTHAVPTSNGSLPLAPVTALGQSPAGNIWAGTSFGGLETLENGAWKFIDSLVKEQASVQILDIQFDTDGLPVVLMNSLWQQWRMLKYDGTKFTEWTSGFSGFNGKRRLRHAGGAWYVSTTRGLFQWKNSALTLFDTSNSDIPTNFLADMDNDSQGNLWMATISKGLVFFDGNGFARFDSATVGLPTDSLLALTVGKDDFPFFSDAKGRLLHFSTGGLQIWKDTTAVADSRILLLDAAPNGGIWLNNKSGVTRFDPGFAGGKWLAFSGGELPFVVADGQARSILATDGFIWVGKNSGIYKIDESCYPPVGTDDAPNVFGSINAFPNPATDLVNFGFSIKKELEIGLKLVNIAGQIVQIEQNQKFAAGENRLEISLAGLPPGIYFYEILGDGRRVSGGKLVKI